MSGFRLTADVLRRFDDLPRRARFWGLFAFIFIVAQLLFAAHAGAGRNDLIGHAPSACEYCLAGAAFDDPSLLVAVVSPPTETFAPVETSAVAAAPTVRSIRTANPRAPPLR